MAFVMCPECKKKISAISENCIYCGYPLMSIRKNQLIDNILMDATIEQLNLSVRAYCALRNAEIKTVRDITALSMIQLIQIFQHQQKKVTLSIIGTERTYLIQQQQLMEKN